jgi:8-oxo-dGTP pyrophosphatase MutT (NUDIX family)
MPLPLLRCACLVDVQDERLLLVRVRENEHWYLPGGKIEPGESPPNALRREVLEELGLVLLPETIRYLYTVVGPAYGQAGEVELVCFSARWQGEPRPLGEIRDVQRIGIEQSSAFAPAVQALCAAHLAGPRARASGARRHEG